MSNQTSQGGENAPSITFWGRLEPRIRTPFLDEVIAASIGDPLWLLGRQWQLGEFEGNDAGTAIRTDIAYQTTQVGTFQAAGQTAVAYNGDRTLNSMVEPEPIKADLRTAVSMGQDFLRFLKAAFTGQTGPDLGAAKSYYIANYSPLASSPDDDAATIRFRGIVAGRSIDGIQLYADLAAAQPYLPAAQTNGLNGILPTLLGLVLQAATAYVNFFQSVFSLPPSSNTAWTNEQLEYQFDVAASKDSTSSIVLSAREYLGGNLDWHSFKMNPASSLATSSVNPNAKQDATLVVVPSHLEFKGMPNRRWWDFEDAQLDPSSIDVDLVGLPKLLLINFVVNQANDWFIMPLPLALGSLTRIKTLNVTDTFGQVTAIQPANLHSVNPQNPWRMFMMSVDSGTPDPNWLNLLFLPPVAGHILEGEVLESVNFLKDEVADMVWGVEDTVQNPAGDPVPGYRGSLPQGASDWTPSGTDPTYILTTSVPPNWIPFLPVYVTPGTPAVNLQEAEILVPTSGPPQPVSPQGVILQPQSSPPGSSPTPYYVREEQVTPVGAVVNRKFRRARWTDGSASLWIGRKRDAGKGEGSSGLRFDAIYDPSTGTFE